ncbi:MAG: Gfo/Idh/MocA family oxidoreductase [Opitutales bacterium]|nr:Gfo/Idh/MocA family oxidoreductase [Opitutales bacterium]
MKRPLRIGIIGSGRIAAVHARNIDAHALATVSAVAGSSAAKARAFIDANQLEARAYGAGTELIEHEALDAVFICLPPFARTEVFEAAAASRLAVFIEKPVALTFDHAEQMAALARKNRLLTMVGYHYRFARSVQRLKAAVESGEAGHPALFEGRFLCNDLHAPWWREVRTSGGQTVEQIAHLYDLATHLFGNVTTVSARFANLLHRATPGYTIEDNAVATLAFANGALGSIASSNCAVPGEWSVDWSAVCKNLTVTAAGTGNSRWTQTNLDPPRREDFNDSDDPYVQEVDHFLRCVHENTPTRCPLEDGLATLALTLAAVESASRDGAVIRV